MEEALSLSDIKAESVEELGQLESGKLRILMEKNRWTIDFGTEVNFVFAFKYHLLKDLRNSGRE